MRIYLDDDTASAALANLLRNAGHDVQCSRGCRHEGPR